MDVIEDFHIDMTDCSTEIPPKAKMYPKVAPIIDDPEELLRKPKAKKTPLSVQKKSPMTNKSKSSPQKKKGPNSI